MPSDSVPSLGVGIELHLPMKGYMAPKGQHRVLIEQSTGNRNEVWLLKLCLSGMSRV